jgi:hypothetical protein
MCIWLVVKCVHKWFFPLTWQKKRNDIAHLCAHKWFFYSHNWKKFYLARLWTHKWFFSFTQEMKRNDITHLWSCKCFYLFTLVKKNNDIAHLWAHKWFFQCMQEKERNDSPHWWTRKWFFHSHVWKKWHFTLVSLQVIFLTHTWEEKMILHICKPGSGFYLFT